MQSDVRRLFRSLGLSAHPYHEVTAEADRAAASARWPLLEAVDRLLGTPACGRRAVDDRPAAPGEKGPSR